MLGFEPAPIDKIQQDTDAGHAFTQLLQERGIISPADIAPLIYALKKCNLYGIVQTVNESFNRNVKCQSPSTTSELQGRSHVW